MADTNIEWATKVWNPTRGCRRVSPGCENCYAERQAIRHAGPGRPYEGLVAMSKHGPRWTGAARFVTEKLAEPLSWRRRDGRHRVFVDSMSDLFFEGFANEEIAACFGVMAASPWNDYLVLTKRIQRALEWFQWVETVDEGGAAWERCAMEMFRATGKGREAAPGTEIRWPLRNVWIGVSVEDQQRADERLPLLLRAPAAVRWVSYEPALGPVNFHPWLCRNGSTDRPEQKVAKICDRREGGIDWIVVGGESGPGARRFDVGWARDVAKRCATVGVPVFVEQLGARPYEHATEAVTFSIALAEKKGGDMAEWHEDLRVREFPR